MPTLTVDVELPDDTYERAAIASPDELRRILTTTSAAHFAVAANRPRPVVKKIDIAADAAAAAAGFDALVAAMAAIPDDPNELDLETLKANLNENRRLTGEEPLF